MVFREFLNIHSFANLKKSEGGPFGDMKKFAKKKSHKAEKNMHKKFWSRAGLESMSFCLADLKKAVTSMPSVSRSSVAQFSVSASQPLKLKKSVSSLVLKTTKVTTIVCVFLRKAPTENRSVPDSAEVPIRNTSALTGRTSVHRIPV